MGWVVNATPWSLYPRERDPVPNVQGWAPGPVWTGAEISLTPEFDPRTVQPVASRFTDCAIPRGSRIRSVTHTRIPDGMRDVGNLNQLLHEPHSYQYVSDD